MRDGRRPRVSVVVPCYDQSAYLDDAVHSCLAAYDGPLEIIVVDDGSTEPEAPARLAALERSVGDADLRVVRQENRGLAAARNAGLRRATGELVQFLDSDDLLARNKLSHQVDHLRLAPSIDASICDYWLCDEDRLRFAPGEASIAPFALDLEDFLLRWERGLSIPIHAALFRRRVLPDCAFPEERRAKEDWLFWVRLALAGARLRFLPLRLAVYRQHPRSMTKRSRLAMGVEWLAAARDIRRQLGGRFPDFMAHSVARYLDYYAAPGDDDAPERAPRRGAARAAVELPRPHAPDVTPAIRAAAASISVVVPVFNHARHLRECLESLRDQTAPPREIACVDDCSSDPAVRGILEQLAREIPGLSVRFLPTNRGISDAQNEGIAQATGAFVAFVDCDDALEPHALATVAAAIVAHPDADYLFTDRIDVDVDGTPLRVARYGGYPEPVRLDGVSHYENLLDAMIASHLKVIRRDRILEVGGFDPRAAGVQDWDLALKISEVGRLEYVREPVYRHRIHAASVTLGRRVEMFRHTNGVCRRYQAIRVRKAAAAIPDGADLAGVAALLASPPGRDASATGFRRDETIGAWRDARDVVVTRAPLAPRDAFRAWAGARFTVFALERDAPVETLAFLREFNSYFDLVVCADEAQWAALHRYAWDSRALRLGDEISIPGEAAPRGEIAGRGHASR